MFMLKLPSKGSVCTKSWVNLCIEESLNQGWLVILTISFEYIFFQPYVPGYSEIILFCILSRWLIPYIRKNILQDSAKKKYVVY